MAKEIPNILNKEAIAARMFRNAARNWGNRDTNIDNFDPLVRLLIEACAVELFRVSNEIVTVQERMLDKLARLLTPEVQTGASPAHGVLHARPVEPEAFVYPEMQFFYHKKIASKTGGAPDSNLDVFFSPVAKQKLVDGDVRCIAAGRNLYSVSGQQYKEVLSVTSPGKEFAPNTLWLGIEISNPQASLAGVSFFFDLKNHPDRQHILPLAQYAKWYVGNKAVAMAPGLAAEKDSAFGVGAFAGFDEFDINRNIEHGVLHFYRQQYVTWLAKDTNFKLELYPQGFEQLVPAGSLRQLQKPLLWVQVQMLPEFSEQVLDDLTVSINSFPVANRRLNEVRYRMQNNFNIVPLPTTDQFLSVHRVQGTSKATEEENKYSSSPFVPRDASGNGTYTLQAGDVERFDSRNAVEYMNYLVELLRDESRAFAAMGQDFVATIIKELNQNISQIEQKVKQNIVQLNQMPTYLLVNPRSDGETIFAEYWTTNGDAANQIRSGVKLELYQGGDLQRESIALMTTTAGGKNKLKKTELLSAYKNTLITRGRVVTLEDVKSFCILNIGTRVKNIEVKKGVAVSKKPNEGLINTINIEISPLPAYKDSGEWQAVAQELTAGLEQQSLAWTNYRVNVLL